MSLQMNSFSKRTATAKNNAAIAAITMVLAKEAKDPLYTKSNGFKKKYMQFKSMIVKKYLFQAKSAYFKKKSGMQNEQHPNHESNSSGSSSSK